MEPLPQCRSAAFASGRRDHPDQVLHVEASAKRPDNALDRPVFWLEGKAGFIRKRPSACPAMR
jgi:hypothetical protein